MNRLWVAFLFCFAVWVKKRRGVGEWKGPLVLPVAYITSVVPFFAHPLGEVGKHELAIKGLGCDEWH